jgi:flagellar capping protein FliD
MENREMKELIIKLSQKYGKYIITFIIGALVTSLFIYSKPNIIPQTNNVLTKDIKNLQTQINSYEKKDQELEKHGASKELTKDPIKYWMTH